MKIALLNGSPKAKNSSSEILLADLKRCLSKPPDTEIAVLQEACTARPEILEAALRHSTVPEETVKNLQTADAWVISCPLYVDGVPGHLLSCLAELEKYNQENAAGKNATEKNALSAQPGIYVYGIVNCGFYEGIQAETALEILENWCAKAGLIWGGGIGVGGGGALAMMSSPKPGTGPKAPIDKALSAMANRILRWEAQPNCYVSVAFPRFLYKMAAQMGWRQMIRANGGRAKDL